MNNKGNDNCNKKNFKRPVSWLLGRDLLAGLKRIAAYTFMGDKFDAKDWMTTKSFTPPWKNQDGEKSYWFDYIADTGDGMNAVYTVAYLCMSDVWTDGNVGKDKVALSEDASLKQLLPRGEFLFVGGDTAYHIADSASLKERFQTPFNCAYDDLKKIKGKPIDRRPLYGIPANHDYYDALDGFNRQFCEPITAEASDPMQPDPKNPQLGLKGFKREQKASYVALNIPSVGWKLWGLDAQNGKMDRRQQAFFVSQFNSKLVKKGGLFDKKNRAEIQEKLKQEVPEKLIVATPDPSTVFGKWADPDDDLPKTFELMGLEASFLEPKNGKLKTGCRLDISGDIHHYERYWGSRLKDKKPSNYASVVAGGGGAFLHPSHTDIDKAPKQALYPARSDSHKLMTRALLNPVKICTGGFIWLAGAIISLMIYFAVTIPQSTWSLFKLLPESLRPDQIQAGLLSKIRVALDDTAIAQLTGCCSSAYGFDSLLIILLAAYFACLLRKMPDYFDHVISAGERTMRIFELADWRKYIMKFFLPPVFAGIAVLIILMLWSPQQGPHSFLAAILVSLFFITSLLLFGFSRRYSDILIERAKYQRETWKELIPLWAFNVLAVIYLFFGFLRYGVYSSAVMTFDMLIQLVCLLIIGLVFLAVLVGGELHDWPGKIRFIAIGGWHAALQLLVPVCLVLYASYTMMAIISFAAVVITFLAGWLFTTESLIKDFTLEQQKKIGNMLFAAWGIFGICVLLAASWGDPIAVSGWRLFFAALIGALFSCIWFGWYLVVSLAFNGHNNESGGGARSESFRHMIRFKLTDDMLTGYVIGIDEPVTDFASTKPPRFRLVDVFTIQTNDKTTKKTAKGKR